MRAVGRALVILAFGLASCTSGQPVQPTATVGQATESAAQASGSGGPAGQSTANESAGPRSPDSTATPAPWANLAPTGPTQVARVVRVVDGDTIRVAIGGAEFTVRYIGMDTPETVKPGSPVEWIGPEASAANTALVDGQDVVLERDVSETDRYGRLLRHVWLHGPEGWLLVGLELVRLGYAQVSTFPPDVRYVDELLAAQRDAREAGRGLWGPEPDSSPAEGASPTASSNPSALPAASCDPAYPGVCIPPPPPDLDCRDVPYRNFTVLPPDPHRFDGDHDGVGCET